MATATPQVVCQHCHQPVRVPVERLGDGPQCPQCRTRLFDGHPVELSDATFGRHVSNGNLPVVVDFWAPWCGPCRMMAPMFEETARRMEPQARFAKLNTDEAQETAARYGIRSIPTLMVFKGGKEVARQSGVMDPTRLNRWLNEALAR